MDEEREVDGEEDMEEGEEERGRRRRWWLSVEREGRWWCRPRSSSLRGL